MYKTRGKPEDPWNKAAAQQEKDLADTIHVNQIRRNGNVQEVEKFIWSPTSRQKELTRLRNNFEQFKDTYHERLRKPNMRGKLLKELDGISESDSSYDRRNTIKRFVSGRLNDVRSNDDTTGCHKPAMLRAPLRTVKPIKVEVPVRYTEAAIFCPQKSGKGEAWSQKLREIEKLQDKIRGHTEIVTEEGGVQTDFVKELQDATIAVDVGNAQLEEINKILEVTKSLGPSRADGTSPRKYGKPGDTVLYNVETPEERLAKILKQKERNASVKNKSKLLLTINDVNDRIQRLQVKFFNEKRPQYKSLRTRYRSNRVQRQLESLYKNENYLDAPSNHDFSGNIPKVLEQNEFLNSPERQINQNPVSTSESSTQYELLQDRGTGMEQSPIRNRSTRESPRFYEIPPLEINTTDSFVEEYLKQSSRSGQHSPTVFIDEPKTPMQQLRRLQQILEVPEEDDYEELATNTIFRPKVQETILKSDFLMKEFNINPNDIHLNMGKMIQDSNRSNKNHVYFSDVAKSNLENMRMSSESGRNSRVFANADYVLKNTLYCTDDE